VCVRAVGA